MSPQLNIIFKPFPILQTQRLLLREIIPCDAGDLFNLRSSSEVMKHIDRPRATTIDDAKKLIQLFDEILSKGEGINWGVSLKDNNKLLGNICLWKIQIENCRAEVGYLLDTSVWRKGIMNEALQAVVDYGFNTMGLHSIEAVINPDNIGSAKLLEKNGFVQEAYFKENYYYDGKFRDTAAYSKLSTNQ